MFVFENQIKTDVSFKDSHVVVFRIGDAGGDGGAFSRLAFCMIDFGSGLVCSGSKSSSRSARGSSTSAEEMKRFTLFILLLYTPGC